MKVKVVYGSPLSGKNTYVDKHMGHNDIVYDYDAFMQALGNTTTHDHNPHLANYVGDIQKVIINRLHKENNLDTAWIIISKPDDRLKQALSLLSPEYIEVPTPYEDVTRRLYASPDGRDIEKWEYYINKYDNPNERTVDVLTEEQTYKFYRSTEWLRLRKAVLERDNFECVRCKAMGRFNKGQTVHHIKHLKKFPEQATDKNNLITVCNSCHNTLHPEKAIVNSKKDSPIHPEAWE